MPSPCPEAQLLHRPASIAFLLLFATNWTMLILKIGPSPARNTLEGLLFTSSAITLLVGLSRRLPLQNILASTALIALIAGGVASLGAMTGIPFGPVTYTRKTGGLIFGVLPWLVPLIWIVAVVSSRGVARLIVRPWRKTAYYGFWVIGLTILFMLTLDLGLEPYAQSRGYWVWTTPTGVPTWHGAPWTNFLGWGVTALGILVVGTPWLINKQPIKQPTDYHPLLVWLLLNIYLATANWLQAYGGAACLCLAIAVGAAVLAVRGGRS